MSWSQKSVDCPTKVYSWASPGQTPARLLIPPARDFQFWSVSGSVYISVGQLCLWLPAVWPWTSRCVSLGSLSHKNQRLAREDPRTVLDLSWGYQMGWVVKLNQMRHITCLVQPLAELVLAPARRFRMS